MLTRSNLPAIVARFMGYQNSISFSGSPSQIKNFFTMTVTKTKHGVIFIEERLDNDVLLKRSYIGYTLAECKKRFRAALRDAKKGEFVNQP